MSDLKKVLFLVIITSSLIAFLTTFPSNNSQQPTTATVTGVVADKQSESNKPATSDSACSDAGLTTNGVLCVVKGKLVSIHYTGKLDDGTVFDTSSGRDPISFVQGTGSVIPGWEQGIEGLTIGTKKILVIPPELAYGKDGFPGVIPPNSTLTFDIEIVSISDPESSVPAEKVNPLVHIDSSQLKKLLFIKTPIIDIRRKEEWLETGIIEGSITKTLYNRDGSTNKDFVPFLMSNGFDKKPFIIICRTGNRTGSAGIGLTKSLGFSKVYNVQGGITDWIDNNLPVVKYK